MRDLKIFSAAPFTTFAQWNLAFNGWYRFMERKADHLIDAYKKAQQEPSHARQNSYWGSRGDDDMTQDKTTTQKMKPMYGNGGKDTLTGTQGYNIMYGGADADTLSGRGRTDHLLGNSGGDKLIGGAGRDVLMGGAGKDVLLGGKGNDSLDGGKGNDILKGGGGGDVLAGGDGHDVLKGEDGRDHLNGGDGQDKLVGGNGQDVLSGGDGHDKLIGGDGDDMLSGGAGNDTLSGGDGDDTLSGGDGHNQINGGMGEDTVSYERASMGMEIYLEDGGAYDDTYSIHDTLISIENVIGSAYDDKFWGNAGGNNFYGGKGNDVVSYEHGPSGVRINLEAGTIWGGFAWGDTLRSIENLIGSKYDDNLTGDAKANILTGGAGADTLNGGEGSDTASYADSEKDVKVNLSTNKHSSGDAWGDTLYSIENLIGSDYRDTLTGDDGDNIFNGGEERDYLTGGGGHDTFRLLHTASKASLADEIKDYVIDDDYLVFANNVSKIWFEEEPSYGRISLYGSSEKITAYAQLEGEFNFGTLTGKDFQASQLDGDPVIIHDEIM